MLRIRSFRRRIFLAILAVALVPASVALLGGTLLLSEIGSSTGTLGPWDAVASSGAALIDAATEAAPDDSLVAGAARRHGDALSSSVRQSRLYTVLTERVIALLPLAALLGALVLAGLAAWTAGVLSRSFAAPIAELVGWAERIGRGDPLPAPAENPRGAAEFDVLRQGLRAMDAELREGREREVEAARLRAWTDMARRIAHELKNPLTPMRMSASALARSADEATRAAAAVLLEEVGRLDEMARTFAQFGRMPEGPAASVDLGELARKVVGRHDGQPVPVAVRLPELAPSVIGHHEVLARALRNLVVNAQEAVQEAGSGSVEVVVSTVGAEASIVVRDDGPGIPEELLERIWLPDVTTKRKGTGIGLAMVRQAAEAHGGSVRAANRRSGGAELTMLLPLAGMPGRTLEETAGRAADAAGTAAPPGA